MAHFLTTTAQGGGMTSLIMIVAMIAVFYFLMIRPENKRKKEAEQMRSAVKNGDQVTTIGGIIGMVVSVKAETFVLETTKDKTKIRFLKAAIRSVDVKAADKAAAILEAKNEAAEAEATEESK